jgi:xanthine dehydrogenase accessory factor
MREVIPDVDRWLDSGARVALATVIETWGSAPRRAGAKMAFTLEGQISGSVSGGCVEGAVFESGVETLQDEIPRLLHYGVADETAWDVGLACGGNIDVFVQALDPARYAHMRQAVVGEKRAASLTVISGPEAEVGRGLLLLEDGEAVSSLGERLHGALREIAALALEGGQTGRRLLSSEGEQPVEVFVEVLEPPPTVIMIGGVQIAIALASLAKTMGFRTVVVDPRRAFGSSERFPHVDRLVQAWPAEAMAEIGLSATTAVVMLTHDPKIDDPALKLALPSQAFYIGALGSRRTQAGRRARLLEAGLPPVQVDRIFGPVGLPIGAQTPEEIALAIMAQIVAVRSGEPASGQAGGD